MRLPYPRSHADRVQGEALLHTETAGEAPLRFGTLGAARITPDALITPIQSHAGVALVAVGARDPQRARAYARKWRIPRAYSGAAAYQGPLASSFGRRTGTHVGAQRS